MITQWNKFAKIFVALFALFTAGILITGPLSATQTNPQDDVQTVALPGQIAPRLQNLGDHKFPVTTNSPRAQLFINQAMMLVYGFNHAEATRSFREAARLDPNCAMAYWGMALVLGPNINMAMPPEAEPQAYEMVQKAIALKKNASEKEKAYIDTLAKRYSGEDKPNRAALDRAYVDAMRELHNRYPDDLDAATLVAQRVCGRITSTRFRGQMLSVSAGVAQWSTSFGSVQEFIAAVDQAMYQAKHAGGRRIFVLAPQLA